MTMKPSFFKRRHKKVCSNCGSRNIEFHGYMMWDQEKQKFLETDHESEIYCFECDDNYYYRTEEIIEVPNNVKVL